MQHRVCARHGAVSFIPLSLVVVGECLCLVVVAECLCLVVVAGRMHDAACRKLVGARSKNVLHS